MSTGQAKETKSEPPYQGGMSQNRESASLALGANLASDPKKPFDQFDISQKNVPVKPFDQFDNIQEATYDILNPEPDFAAQSKKAFAIPEVVKPGEYHPGYCKQMLEFFNREKYRTITEEYVYKSGAIESRNKRIPAAPPEFSEFARSIGVSKETLKRWKNRYPEFREAYNICADIYEEFLVHHGLLGNYGAIMSKFVATNRTSMKDKQIVENQTVDINRVLDQIAEGKVRPGGLLESGDTNEEEDY